MAAHHAATPRTVSARNYQECRAAKAAPASDMALGQRRAPPAQANQSPPEIDYGTESVVTSHTTSARAQCKGLVSRSSCGIAAAGRAASVIRASEAVP
jgi:hypothetical protein